MHWKSTSRAVSGWFNYFDIKQYAQRQHHARCFLAWLFFLRDMVSNTTPPWGGSHSDTAYDACITAYFYKQQAICKVICKEKKQISKRPFSLFVVKQTNTERKKRMLYGEKMEEILQKCNIDCDNLPDKLFSTKLNAICDAVGSGGGSSGGGSGGSGGFPIGDGNTHMWISLPEGRTSPMLGVCPNGTVTVDWGDGTEPDILTGTGTTSIKFTPNHNYESSGDYVITLTVDGEMGFGENGYFFRLNSSSTDYRNQAYYSAVRKVELADGVTRIGSYAFKNCYSLSDVIIPDSVSTISMLAFQNCYSLASITIPASVKYTYQGWFSGCYSLQSVTFPDGIKSISSDIFYSCYALQSVNIPDSVTSIDDRAFSGCSSLASIVIPGGVTSVGGTVFHNCKAVRFYDFTQSTAVPTLSSTSAFNGIASDCEIRVPAALVDEWKAATNWATYAYCIVGV